MFQYKTLHDVVLTERKSSKAKLASSDLCYLCLKTKQDLKHMLVSCPVVTVFWKTFLEWYETLTAAKLELSTVKISLASISVARTKVALSLQGLSLAKSLK